MSRIILESEGDELSRGLLRSVVVIASVLVYDAVAGEVVNDFVYDFLLVSVLKLGVWNAPAHDVVYDIGNLGESVGVALVLPALAVFL